MADVSTGVGRAKYQLQREEMQHRQRHIGDNKPESHFTGGAAPVAAVAPRAMAPATGAIAAGATISGVAVSQEALASLAEAKKQYQPGGGYGAGLEATLERGAKKSIAAGTQSLVSAGLASTSMGAGLGKQYEEEIATPARADLESRRAVALSGLETLEAQMQQGGSQSALDRGLSLQQQQIGISAGVSEASLDRQFQTNQTLSARNYETQRVATANRVAQPSLWSMNLATDFGPTASSVQPSAPTAGQHITSSTGVSSFLANLRSQDIMSAPDWNFGT